MAVNVQCTLQSVSKYSWHKSQAGVRCFIAAREVNGVSSKQESTSPERRGNDFSSRQYQPGNRSMVEDRWRSV